ncbi:MAG: Gfo/Idh/MocA family oxidoreductase [Saprospiraceae bacterium]|nr:Gfo/Idh/MocA family oxidoreductase [Saprospiraceae bacterium]
MDQIKIGIIGFGRIGKRHAAIIEGHPSTKLVAICDQDPAAFAERQTGHVPTFESLDQMLATHPEMDVLSICTPNGLHADHALRALDAKLHVLCEKPMALTRSGCEAVISKALDASRKVFCVMQNRYSPTVTWLKEVLHSGKLGKIALVQMNCFWNRDDRYYSKKDWHGTLALDGGPLFTQFSHFVDLLYWCFGDISDINARFENFNHQHSTEFEDSGLVQFKLEQGGLGTIQYSTAVWDQNFESSITVIAENGTLKIGGQYMDRVEFCHIRDYVMPELPPANAPNDYGNYKGSAANHHHVYANLVDVIHGNGAISTNALQGMKVVEIIERIYQQRGSFK